MEVSFSWDSPTSNCRTSACYLQSLSSTFSTSAVPLSNPALLPPLVLLYLLLLQLVRRLSSTPSPQLTTIAVVHNLFLSIFSILLNIYTTATIISEGPLSLFCRKAPPARSSAFILYLFYVSKWYELLDSFIIATRGGHLTLLHLWHHSSVLFETWFWNEFGMVYAIYGVWFNTFVHVFMYAYYAMALLGRRVWWKKWLTALQIVQFCCSFVLSIPFVWLGGLKNRCIGREAFFVSVICNGSYLWLFLRFYRRTYRQDRNGNKGM